MVALAVRITRNRWLHGRSVRSCSGDKLTCYGSDSGNLDLRLSVACDSTFMGEKSIPPHPQEINPLNAELNPTCHLLALLGVRPILHISRIKVKHHITKVFGGPGSAVGIATALRVGRSGDRIPVEARFSAPVQTSPGAHPSSCTIGTGSFPGVNCGWGVTLTPHPFLVSWS